MARLCCQKFQFPFCLPPLLQIYFQCFLHLNIFCDLCSGVCTLQGQKKSPMYLMGTFMLHLSWHASSQPVSLFRFMKEKTFPQRDIFPHILSNAWRRIAACQFGHSSTRVIMAGKDGYFLSISGRNPILLMLRIYLPSLPFVSVSTSQRLRGTFCCINGVSADLHSMMFICTL